MIPRIICEYLDTPSKSSQFEAILIDNYLCDECYKVLCSHSFLFPKRCLLSITSYEVQIKPEGLNLNILKASVKSVKVQDHSGYLCLAEHNTQVVQTLQKFRHSQLIQKFSYEESQFGSLPEPATVTNPIGFGLNSVEKSLKFANQRSGTKILQSQDDILSALPIVQKVEESCLEFPDFPDWALAYLMHKYKVNRKC